jgi:hypothetical protein
MCPPMTYEESGWTASVVADSPSVPPRAKPPSTVPSGSIRTISAFSRSIGNSGGAGVSVKSTSPTTSTSPVGVIAIADRSGAVDPAPGSSPTAHSRSPFTSRASTSGVETLPLTDSPTRIAPSVGDAANPRQTLRSAPATRIVLVHTGAPTASNRSTRIDAPTSPAAMTPPSAARTMSLGSHPSEAVLCQSGMPRSSREAIQGKPPMRSPP